MQRIHVSLGSNVGDRQANLRNALESLARQPRMSVAAVSSCYETEPVGGVPQGPFLNIAAEIETDMNPLEFLDAVKGIEQGLGRTPTRRWGPRVIDIDLVLWGDAMMETPRLTLPHPRFRERAFVLAPLADIAPDAVDPVTGRTVREQADEAGREGVAAFPNWKYEPPRLEP